MAPPRVHDPLAAILAKLEKNGKEDDTHKMLANLQLKMWTVNDSLQKLLVGQEQVATWQPEMETKVIELKGSIFDLRLKVDVFIHEIPKKSDLSTDPDGKGMSTPAHLGVPSKEAAFSQNGPGFDNHYRSLGTRVRIPGTHSGHRCYSTPILHLYSIQFGYWCIRSEW